MLPGGHDHRFEEDGFVILRGAFEQDAAEFLRATVWRHIEGRTSIRLADPATWSCEQNFGLRPVEERLIWSLVTANAAATEALDALLGPGAWQPPGPPQVLLTFPVPEPWTMPRGWHIDFGCGEPTWPVPAIKLFAFLDTVPPGGGGTLVLAGSHQLVERWAIAAGGHLDDSAVHHRFGSDPNLEGLRRGGGGRSLLGAPVTIDGVTVRPLELTGDAGDVVLTHMHVFHSPSPNVSDRPRQMLGNAILRVKGADQL